MKKEDINTVYEALNWDPRGAAVAARARRAFGRIERELSAQCKSTKVWEQKYNELMRMQETYIKRLHALEASGEKK